MTVTYEQHAERPAQGEDEGDAAYEAATRQYCAQILELLLPHRRPVGAPDEAAAGDGGPHDGHRPEECFAEQLAQLRDFVARREPVLLTLPAFPCKSPNPAKVAGHLPDLGELLSLRFLDDLCVAIGAVYPPGARLLICSDGHVFGDLIRVPDAHIDAYGKALRDMIEATGLKHIDTFGLDQVYEDRTYDEKRALLERDHAQSLEELRDEVRGGGPALSHYRGTIRFLVEDTADWTGSKAQLQRECRGRAYGVLRRSRAWGELIAHHYPRNVRLSIHPQPCGAAKFGIALLEAADNWLTPWHAVVVQTGTDRFRLMKRHEAERVGIPAGPSWRPSHYIASELFDVAS
ncbi:isocyanide synthase family protein [Streptomyces rimosus]|uniref:L-tyrosine/L-tryptophan isonitrile synthase family protein n=1 Tax=Streptomyces rimosus TaxID=1927 RepID=UPI000518F3EC|nr:isocyanide synthase family protein [Streptomyces rimosus]